MGLSFVYDKIIKNPSLAGHIITEMLLSHYNFFFWRHIERATSELKGYLD